MHQKLDLLTTEQMKAMFELQRLQLGLIREIKSPVDTGPADRPHHDINQAGN